MCTILFTCLDKGNTFLLMIMKISFHVDFEGLLGFHKPMEGARGGEGFVLQGCYE